MLEGTVERPPMFELGTMVSGRPLTAFAEGLARSESGRFLGFGKRGGTRRLKFATTSGGEFLFKVGCAVGDGQSGEDGRARKESVHQVLASGSSMAGSTLRRLTLRMNP